MTAWVAAWVAVLLVALSRWLVSLPDEQDRSFIESLEPIPVVSHNHLSPAAFRWKHVLAGTPKDGIYETLDGAASWKLMPGSSGVGWARSMKNGTINGEPVILAGVDNGILSWSPAKRGRPSPASGEGRHHQRRGAKKAGGRGAAREKRESPRKRGTRGKRASARAGTPPSEEDGELVFDDLTQDPVFELAAR